MTGNLLSRARKGDVQDKKFRRSLCLDCASCTSPLFSHTEHALKFNSLLPTILNRQNVLASTFQQPPHVSIETKDQQQIRKRYKVKSSISIFVWLELVSFFDTVLKVARRRMIGGSNTKKLAKILKCLLPFIKAALVSSDSPILCAWLRITCYWLYC